MSRNQKDNTDAVTGVWSTTNNSTDRSIDANGADAEIGDGLTTLIIDLVNLGVIPG